MTIPSMTSISSWSHTDTHLLLNWSCWSQRQGVLLLQSPAFQDACSQKCHLIPHASTRARALLQTPGMLHAWRLTALPLGSQPGKGKGKRFGSSSYPGITCVGSGLSGCFGLCWEPGEQTHWEAERVKEQRNSSSWRLLILSSSGRFLSFPRLESCTSPSRSAQAQHFGWSAAWRQEERVLVWGERPARPGRPRELHSPPHLT